MSVPTASSSKLISFQLVMTIKNAHRLEAYATASDLGTYTSLDGSSAFNAG